MGGVETIKLDLPPAIKGRLQRFCFRPNSGGSSRGKAPLQISHNRLSLLSLLHFQLNGLLLTGQLVCCQLTALTKKDLLNTDSFHLH